VSVAGVDAASANVSAEVMIKGSVYGYDTYAQAVANKSAYASVTNILTATGLWATNNDGFPVIKSLQYPDSTTLTAQNVVIGGSLDLSINDSFFAGITSSWSSATAGATVSGNVVTVDPVMPEDSTITVTATNQYGFSKSFSLTAIKATQVTGTAQKLHKVKATQTIAIEAEGTCESILIAGTPVETYEFVSGVGVTFTKEAIANVPNGKGTMLVLTKNGDEYTETSIALDVASMVITTKEELLEFASLPRETTWGVGELYVIDADIDMEGAEYGINVNTNGANNVTGGGFAGTFDGRGHVIKNITMVGNGFISGIRRDGVLKNVAFLNATQKSQGFLSMTTHGPTVENIYAQITSEYNGNAGFLGGDNYSGKCFSNIVVDVTGKVGNYYLLHSHYNRNYGTLKDVYMIGATGITAGTTSNPSTSVDNVQIFANYSAFVAGGNDTEGNAIVYTDMDNDFWNIVGGVPVPASVVTNVAPVIANTEVSNLAVRPITLEIQDNIPFVTISLSSAVDGVSVLGRKVNVTSAAAGRSFTVVVTNPVTNASASKTFSIRSVNEVTLTNRIDMDLGAGDTVAVDMSEVFTQYGITDPATEIESATVAGQDAMFTVDGNNLVFQSSMLKMESTLGEKDLRLSVTTTGGDMYDLLQPVTVISKIIMNKEDAVNMINYAITPNEGGDTKMGYFVLGADVDAEGSQIGIGYYTTSAVNTVYRSTFDGRGHTLSNVVYTENASGLFGMSNDCTFKNLIMRNVTVNQSGASPLSESAGGTTTVTNVFIEGNLNGGTPKDWGEQSLVIGKAGGPAAVINMTNVYTVVTATNYTDTSFAGTHFGERGVFGSFTNCVGLDLSGKGLRLAFDGNTFTNSQVVTTKVAAAALTGHSGTAWDAFKAYCQA
ncbi:MAG: hypothetical protein IKC64_01815, partial [Clostridia bacterium]|nr:hypothetical protein [Clostridia bacterium]